MARVTRGWGRDAGTTVPAARRPPAGSNPCRAQESGGEALAGSVPLQLFDLLDHLRDHLEEVADDAVAGDLEDRGFGVLVDRHDDPRRGHAGEVLDGAGNT